MINEKSVLGCTLGAISIRHKAIRSTAPVDDLANQSTKETGGMTCVQYESVLITKTLGRH